MQTRPQLLNPQGLLAALVAMTLSGMALAETAGRVNFVSGGVVAVASDGSKRTLTRGDFVNSGERIETNKGRVQIRFTDGSFLSLQPDTVFGVDNYTFSKAKPEEGSLLFNFVRGSMRTVSGAIGKVNRANYKVKTPVATIGIRGTGYASSFRNGLLLVSVNHGMVNIANDSGSSNVPSGQTFQARDGEAPAPAPAGTVADARADSPAGNAAEEHENRLEMARNEDPSPRAGEQVDSEGNSVIDLPLTPMLSDTNPITNQPLYSVATPLIGELTGGSRRVQDYGSATFNTGTETRGGLLTLFAGEGGAMITRPTTGAAKQVNVQTGLWSGGGLSFGEWTDGTLLLGSGSTPIPVALAANQFMPYIIGSMADAPGSNLYVEYSLHDRTQASAARVADGSDMTGTLDALSLGLDLSASMLYLKDFKVTLTPAGGGNSTVYTASGSTGMSLNLHGFSTSSGIETLNSQDINCTEGVCTTTLDGFFTGAGGDLLGIGYVIDNAQSSGVHGVGVLVQDHSYEVRSSLPDTADGASTGLQPLYSFGSTVERSDEVGQTLVLDVKADFEQNLGANQGGLLGFSESPFTTPLFSNTNARYVNLMTDTASGVSIGELTGGTIHYTGDNLSLVNNTSFMSYVVGVTPQVIPDNNLKITYALHSFDGQNFAGTPRFADGRSLPAQLDKLNLSLDLAEGLIDVDLKLTTGLAANSTTYTATAIGLSRPSASTGNAILIENGELTSFASGADSTCAEGCDTRLGLFFTGTDGNKLGATYSILKPTTGPTQDSLLGGVAVLTKTGETVAASTPDAFPNDPDGLSSGVFAADATDLASHTLADASLFYSQSTGALLEATGTNTSGTVRFGRHEVTALETKDVSHYRNTLAWGRWTGGAPAAIFYNSDLANPSTVALENSNIHYLVGQAADFGPGSAIQALKDQNLTVTYLLAGGTSPTSFLVPVGASVGASVIGTLGAGQVSIDFGQAKASFSLDMTMPTDLTGQTTTLLAIDSNGFTGSLTGANLDFSSVRVFNNDSQCSTCTGSASGFVAGQNADMVGLSYKFQTSDSTNAAAVSGVAGFDATVVSRAGGG